MMRFIRAFRGLVLMFKNLRIFDPRKHFAGKRIAIVGPAASVMKEENGEHIDGFDYVIRINKAPYSLKPEKARHLGTRTDILFHSFYENNETGGGPLDFDLYEEKSVGFVINPRNTFRGLRMTFNFYKKYLRQVCTYVLPADVYKRMQNPFSKELRPTVGFTAVQAALETSCKEVFITGFTFFKTPYAPGYRDNLLDMDVNQKHLKNHGIHDPDLEFSLFLALLSVSKAEYVHFDKELTAIIAAHQA